MERVAFFGAGMLGSGFVHHLCEQGIAVNVWNRTFAKAQALQASGARAFEDAADAARDVDIVHLCVRDGDAVDAILERASSGLAAGVPVVDHTTVAPASVARRVTRLAERGNPFMHAPVFMGPPQARSGAGTMLASGRRELFERLDSHLAKLADKRQYLGERADAAALYKLMGNLMILATVGGLRDMFALAEVNGISRDDAYALFSFYSPQGQISGRGKRMAEGDYDAAWTIDMALKDATLMQGAAPGTRLDVVDAVALALKAHVASGDASLDLGAIAKRSG